MYVEKLRKLIVRDSNFYDNGRRAIQVVNGIDDLSMQFYRNEVFVPKGTTDTIGLQIASNLKSFQMFENYFYFDGPIEGNYDAAIGVRFNSMGGWLSDRNQYWAPQADGQIFHNIGGSEFLTLAQWQGRGVDLHSVYADPGWVDPANGDFRKKM